MRALPIWVLSLAIAPLVPAAASGARAFRCVNPASGAAWTLRIDPARGTVDGAAARIGPHRISWIGKTDLSRNELDPATGLLTIVHGSSTGGWVQRMHCGPVGVTAPAR